MNLTRLEQINLRRERLKLTRAELAVEAGYSPDYGRQVLAGQHQYARTLNAFEVTLDKLEESK